MQPIHCLSGSLKSVFRGLGYRVYEYTLEYLYMAWGGVPAEKLLFSFVVRNIFL